MSIMYTGGRLDRAGAQRKDATWVAERLADPNAVAIASWNDRNLVRDTRAVRLTMSAVRDVTGDPEHAILLGVDDGVPVFAVDVSEAHADAIAAAAGTAWAELRRATPTLDADDAALLAYARAMLLWNRRHRFCSVSGDPAESHEGGHVRVCTNVACGHETYPRTDPAVIMLVERNVPGEPPTCLLAHHSRLAPGMFSTLAGFVEPGESLEEAVAREVLEETSVRVERVRYVASQPWPFPASIMLGFRADATTHEITIDPAELSEARWFTADELRAAGEWGAEGDGLKLPRRDSIARVLVDGWLRDVG